MDALVNGLETRKIRCWYTPRDIPAGLPWPAAIAQAIEHSSIMLLVFSESSNNSEEVARELALASNNRKVVIPLRIENVLPGNNLKFHLSNRHWLDVYGMAMDAVVKHVLDALGNYTEKLPYYTPEQGEAPGPARPVQVPPRSKKYGLLAVLAGGLALLGATFWFGYAGGRSAEQALSVPGTGHVPLSSVQEAGQPATPSAPETGQGTASVSLSGKGQGTKVPPLAGAERVQVPRAPAETIRAPAVSPVPTEASPAGPARPSGPDRNQAQPASPTAEAPPASPEERALAGDPGPALALGRSLLAEQGGTAEALRLLRLAAGASSAEAQTILGDIYYRGTGVKQDREQAAQWYAKAAASGYAEAQCNLAYLYQDGASPRHDVAAFWFRQAAEQGHAAAQYSLGEVYEYGQGVPTDMKEAFAWYLKAAAGGDSTAQYKVGLMYHKGQGTKADEVRALYWLQKAGDQGDPLAQDALRRLLP